MKVLRGLTILLVVGLTGRTWGGRVQARAREITTLDLPTAPATSTTFVNGINQQGDIVGSYGDSTGTHGFLLRGGKYTTLNDPKGKDGTSASGINEQGDIVGYFTNSRGTHGFLLRAGKYTTLNAPNACTRCMQGTRASGIDQQGDIVGTYSDSTGTHGFLLHQGTYTILNVPKGTPRRTLASIPAATVSRLTVRRVRMPANPVAAVKLLAAFTGATDPCHPSKSSSSAEYLQARGCPVTLRLQRRLHTLTKPTGFGGGADPVCRCQQKPPRTGYHLDHMSSGKAQVTVNFGWYRMAFQLVQVSIGWLVDNTYCAGRPALPGWRGMHPRWPAVRTQQHLSLAAPQKRVYGGRSPTDQTGSTSAPLSAPHSSSMAGAHPAHVSTSACGPPASGRSASCTD